MTRSLRSASTAESSYHQNSYVSFKAVAKVAVSDTILSPTTAHCVNFCSQSDANASSMLMRNMFPPTPQSCPPYEPSNSQMLWRSGLLRRRRITENRALATWISLMMIQSKLTMENPGIVFDEHELLRTLICQLTKSFQLVNPPTPVIFIALLYLYRIFPDRIPYSGNPDHECATALQRLFLLCIRLALQWFEDQSEFWDFRARRFKWHEHLGLEQTVFRNADVHVLHLLGHNLCVSNIAYARWLSHLLSDLPVFLDDHLEERRTVGQLIHAIRPSLTSGFLSLNGLPCNGLPFDKDWTTAISCIEECAERKQNLMDCITYGLYIPLYISPTQPSYSDSKLATEPTPNISLDIDWSPTVREISTESSRPRIFVGVTSPDIGRLPIYGDSSESDQKGKMLHCLSSSSTCVHACTLPLSHSGPTEYPSFSISSIQSTLYHAAKLLRGFLKS
ncbi:hypothetical protein C8J55DRAFT_498917 [Lentinula edodes]|uniref:Uncharacterized protein n=1 Tax=Lentinula lateritia TaxID=40482 RepID=A0A9W9DZW9_9AGAR|nr:hypothetical protein C8J55DRAFT_498917 [Lentinula edodes]